MSEEAGFTKAGGPLGQTCPSTTATSAYPPPQQHHSEEQQEQHVPLEYHDHQDHPGDDAPPHKPANSRSRASTHQSSAPASPTNNGSSASGQRELILPKVLSPSASSPPDERRTSSSHRAPPVSYKPVVARANTTPVRVPPIRGFRSSGSRKSLVLDMNDFDANHDHTLRALEGTYGQGALPMTPPTSARHEGLAIGDDAGDVFMRIAREEPKRRDVDEHAQDDTRSMVSTRSPPVLPCIEALSLLWSRAFAT